MQLPTCKTGFARFDLCFKEQIQKLALKLFICECNLVDLIQRWQVSGIDRFLLDANDAVLCPLVRFDAPRFN